MTRFRTAAVLAAAVAACSLVAPSPAQKQPDAPAPKKAEPAPPAQQVLVKGLRDAMKNDDEQPFIRLLMATALVKVAPDDEDAAKVLVAAMTEDGNLAADAYQSIGELIPTAPPALIRALVPVLKDRKDINRQRAAALLAKIDPKNLP